jgi:hypothetical protein
MRKPFAVAASTVIVLLLAPGVPSAQEGIPDTFTNLQMFPKDIPKQDLVEAMKKISRSLGVRCNFCHVAKEGTPKEKELTLADFDFASDDERHKRVAREMMKMTGQINRTLEEIDQEAQRVGCWTCHRGEDHPAPMPSPSPAAPAASPSPK